MIDSSGLSNVSISENTELLTTETHRFKVLFMGNIAFGKFTSFIRLSVLFYFIFPLYLFSL